MASHPDQDLGGADLAGGPPSSASLHGKLASVSVFQYSKLISDSATEKVCPTETEEMVNRTDVRQASLSPHLLSASPSPTSGATPADTELADTAASKVVALANRPPAISFRNVFKWIIGISGNQETSWVRRIADSARQFVSRNANKRKALPDATDDHRDKRVRTVDKALQADDALPNDEAHPNAEALSSGKALPNAEALSSGKALPNDEALSEDEALPKDEALPTDEAVPSDEAPPDDDAARPNDAEALRKEHNRLKRMEVALRTRVFGQDEAIRSVSEVICCSIAGYRSLGRPIASFLFLGPSGVGKTEMATGIAEFLSSGEKPNLVELDLSRFRAKSSLPALIKTLADAIDGGSRHQSSTSSRPESPIVIAFDRIEEANADVLSIVLGIVDTGVMFDCDGVRLSFENTVICLNTNAGCQDMYQPGAIHPKGGVNRAITRQAQAQALRGIEEKITPELLSRLERPVMFDIFGRKEQLDIVGHHVKKARAWLKERRVEVDVSRDALDLIAKQNFSEACGAGKVANAVSSQFLHALYEQAVPRLAQGKQVYLVTAEREILRFRSLTGSAGGNKRSEQPLAESATAV